MDYNEFTKMYWSQYLLYEREFINTFDYVTLDSMNNATFSNQFLKLIFAICSEIDSASAIIAKSVSEDITTYSNIVQKIETIKIVKPNLLNIRATTKYPFEGYNCVPFQRFKENQAAPWWQDYNALKHARTDPKSEGRPNYMSAKLENVLQAIAALYILNCVMCERIVDKSPPELISHLFNAI